MDRCSTHHVRQPVRTFGNFALVRLGRACEVFSDCLEAMAGEGRRRHGSGDTWWASRKGLCAFEGRTMGYYHGMGPLIGRRVVVRRDGAVERFKLSPLPVNLVLK